MLAAEGVPAGGVLLDPRLLGVFLLPVTASINIESMSQCTGLTLVQLAWSPDTVQKWMVLWLVSRAEDSFECWSAADMGACLPPCARERPIGQSESAALPPFPGSERDKDRSAFLRLYPAFKSMHSFQGSAHLSHQESSSHSGATGASHFHLNQLGIRARKRYRNL